MRKLHIAQVAISLVLFLFLNATSFAQVSGSADVQFELQAYELAIDSYLDYLEICPDDEEAMNNLAIAYERTNDLISAAQWYEKLFLLNADRPEGQKLAFGKVLSSLGLYDQAAVLFESCKSVEHSIQTQMLKDGNELAEELLKAEENYLVYLYNPSSQESDFAPSFWNDELVFASFREETPDENELEFTLFHTAFNKLYTSGSERKNSEADVKLFGSENFPKEGISSCHFSLDGKKVLFTRNGFKNNNRQIRGDEKGLSIYMADVDEKGDFLNEYALPFNSTEYSSAFACFGNDKNTIYFSSNRHGDHNDFDLYRSVFNGIAWSEPLTLGEMVNSPGNEVSPYYVDGVLYFSSDVLPGMGGYDVFRSQLINGFPETAYNMGKGINSIADDLYLVQNPGNKEYYYTSNRLGGEGKYDIYVSVPNETPEIDESFLAVKCYEAEEAPNSVVLEEMEEDLANEVSISESVVVGYSENELAPENISLEGAVKVAYGEVLAANSSVYFIQLASLSSTKGNINQFRKLVEFGNVYRVKKSNSYKIRLGYFHVQSEANSALSQIRQAGFRDAFIVEDILNVKELELLISSFTFSENEKYTKPEIESEYKVRLAAYSNPLFFDTEKIKDIGVIEQWSKGKWTIFILSGYSDLDAAKQARIKAVNRGFTGAEIVRDEGGVLSRVKEN